MAKFKTNNSVKIEGKLLPSNTVIEIKDEKISKELLKKKAIVEIKDEKSKEK